MAIQKEITYDHWYEAYADEMFSYGMAFGIGKETVLDAIHDVFLHLYEKGNKADTITNVKFYLLSSLKNRIISLKRKEIPFENIDDSSEYEFLIKVDGLELIEDKEERDLYTGQIEYLLSLLTSKQREVIYLHFMQELSYEEIAQMLDITTKSVRKLTYRAIERMQEEKIQLAVVLLCNYTHIEIVLDSLPEL